MDKRLIHGYLKHAKTHNRLMEEEISWKEHKVKSASRYERRRLPDASGNWCPSIEQRSESEQREWRRERKRRHDEISRKISASAKGGTEAIDFWREVVRYKGAPDRWGHDGFDELCKPGPLTPLLPPSPPPSHPQTASRKSPVQFASKSSSSLSSSSKCSSPLLLTVSKGKKMKSKRKEMKTKKRKMKKHKKYRKSVSSSSSSIDGEPYEIEWMEKPKG